ncbi:MAG: DcaP family trimeric outer membrane transporter [Colwellia sp.]|nr:DcaP family trimeric outer membrane transporter [Colwellia sp.]
MFNNKFKKLLLASSILVATGAANAGYEIKLSEEDKIAFGGYIKVDARHVNGEVAYRDFWLGAGTAGAAGAPGESKSQTKLMANESRFNMKYTHGEVMGFIELDFINSLQGNQIVSNSVSPRLRHAFIKYQDFTVGQTWTTFMNTSALAETLDFAGTAMGEVFIRQAQVRYTNGGLQLSLENPETHAGDTTEDSVPDFVAKYTFKDDWGNVSVAGLVRQLNTAGGESETSVGYSIAGRINTVGKDDLRFQYSGGEIGRYVGVVSATDVVGEEVEETDAYLVAYRHFWTEDTRSTLAYGTAEADISGWESTQWSLNLIKNLTKQLSVGVEVGNYSRDDLDIDSDFAQFSLKYVL